MLITKEVTTKWSPSNKKWYENKGYIFTKWNDEFEAKVEDLQDFSHMLVDVQCDHCGEIIKNTQWKNYLRCVKRHGKYYCQECRKKQKNYYQTISKHQTFPISITSPEVIKFLVNKEDALKYSKGSKAQLPMKCPDCGLEKRMRIERLIRSGIACPKCSDGVSYPEKFMFQFFEQLSLIFKVQLSKTTFSWCKGYRYDFYIEKINGIIEAGGLQHYEEINNNWNSLEETQNNDFDKEWLARENKIKNYLIIDCRKSELKWIKDSIMRSRLPKLLGFEKEDIDWLKCHEWACSSLVKVVCELWDREKQNTLEISNRLKISTSTIRKYLKQGVELGWCDYNFKNIINKNLNHSLQFIGKKVICITTEEIFNSLTEASKKYDIKLSGISNCCSLINPSKSAGIHPATKESLVWVYYDDYLNNKDKIGWLDNYLNNNNKSNKKVICLTTSKVFNSLKEAGIAYKIDSGAITRCCKGELKSSGKHPITREKLIWMYYNDFKNLSAK